MMFRSLFQKTPLKRRRAISGGALVLIATTMWGAVVGTAKLRRSGGAAAEAGKPRVMAAAHAADFNRDVLPIFQASCTPCHGADKAEARLRLDSEAAVLRGGVSGKAVISGNSKDSLLVKRLLGLNDLPRMPLSADPLATAQINKIRAWIDRGDFAPAAPEDTGELAGARAVEPALSEANGTPALPDLSSSG